MSINFSVRWADNTPDLKRNLREGLDQIEVTRSAVEKLSRSLEGENQIKSANNWAAALHKLGGEGGVFAGVQKLTAGEVDRANAAIDRAAEKYTLLGKAIPSTIAALKDLLNAQVATAKATEAAGKAAEVAAKRFDALAQGMSAAGKTSVDSLKLIAGMGAAGADAAAKIAALNKPLDAMAAGLSVAGKQANASGKLIAGMSAAGAEAASKVAAVGTESEKAAKSVGLFGGAFSQVLAGFTAAALVNKAVGAITDLGREALATAGTLVDLSNKTGLSTETLQRMQFVGKQSGTEMSVFADAAFKMGVNISEGTKKARDGAESLGLSWTALRGASPDVQFDMVVQALEKMEDPQKRNAAAVALFGKTAKDILPAIVDGYTQVAKAATIAGDAQVRAIDRESDAWDAWKTAQVTSLTQLLGSLVLRHEAITTLTTDEREFVKQSALSSQEFEDWILHANASTETIEKFDAAIMKAAESKRKFGNIGGLSLEGMGLGGGIVGPLQGDRNLPTAPKPVPSFGDDLKAAEAGYRALTAAKKADLEAGLKLGASNEDLINNLNVTEGVLSVAKKAFEDHKSAVSKAADAQNKYAESLARYNSTDGPTYLSILDTIGNEMFEGIAFDMARGKSAEDLVQIYKTTSTVIAQVIAAEKNYAEASKATLDNIAESRAAALEAAAAVSKAFAGPQTVLKDLLISTGAVPISLKSILTPAQELGHLLTDVTVSAKEHFDDLDDAITGDFTDIVATMHDAGVQTRDDLRRTADAFKAQYQAMLASGKFTAGELAAAWGRYRQAVTASKQEIGSFRTVLGSLSNDFAQLSQIGGDSFSPIAREIGTAVKAVDLFATALKATKEASAAATAAGTGLSASTIAGLAASWLGVAVAVYQVATALWEMKKAADEAHGAVLWARELQGYFHAPSMFSDQLAASIRRVADAMDETEGRAWEGVFPGETRQAIATALQLSDVIKELGGVSHLTATQLADVKGRTRILLDLITTDGPRAVAAAKELDDVLMQFADNQMAHGGIVDQYFLATAKRAKKYGMEMAGVTAFMEAQASSAETGLSAALAVTNDAYAKRKDLKSQIAALGTSDADKAKALELTKQLETQDQTIAAAGLHSQQAADAVSGGLLGIIDSQILAGKSFHESVVAIAPAVDALSAQMIEAGYSGGAAFDLLRAQVALATDAVAGPALTAVEGYAAGLRGLNNAGLLNQDMFAGLSSQIGATRDALIAQGKDGGQVLSAMRGPLQTLWELETKFGYTTDEATQALIDQAKEQGLVGDKFKPIAEQQLDATKDMTKAIHDLTDAFRGLPSAAHDAADGITHELSQIKTPTLKIPVNGFLAGDQPDGGDGFESHLMGYARGTGGIKDFGLGTDVTLHGREGVFTEEQVATMTQRGRFLPMPDLSGGLGFRDPTPLGIPGTVGGPLAATPAPTYHITVQAWNGTDTLRMVRSREFVDALVSAAAQNKSGLGTGLRSALQVDG